MFCVVASQKMSELWLLVTSTGDAGRPQPGKDYGDAEEVAWLSTSSQSGTRHKGGCPWPPFLTPPAQIPQVRPGLEQGQISSQGEASVSVM